MIDLAYPLIRSMLFTMDAERAHEVTLDMLHHLPGLIGMVAGSTMGPPPKSLAFEAFGLKFGGPVGLAAGLDKNGVAIPFWPSLGFGFIEVGTVTAHPQAGNEKPRLFRIPADRALINRMGFNNGGSEALAVRLRALRDAGNWPSVPVGVNIGKSKITPLDEAHIDYATSTKRLADVADYFTVNVSSPNTPGLRKLQDASALSKVLTSVLEVAGDTPVLVKFAPDMPEDALDEAVDLAIEVGVAGIIATNTTLSRAGLTVDPKEAGGLSGAPLWPLSRTVVQRVLDRVDKRVDVIGVGGISTPGQAAELLDAGCTAVQLYSALVFEGPGLPNQINQVLASR